MPDPSPLVRRSRVGRPSPVLCVDDMSLPALDRRCLDAGDRVAYEVAEVESSEPTWENEPPVQLADDDDPRFQGIAAGNGVSAFAAAPAPADPLPKASAFSTAVDDEVAGEARRSVSALAGTLGVLRRSLCTEVRRLAETGASPAFRLLLRVLSPEAIRVSRGELRPSSRASAAAVSSSCAAASSISTSTPSTSRVCRKMDAATTDGDD